MYAGIAVASLFATSSCSKSMDTPFTFYFVSTDRDFPKETRVIYNSNYIGDVQKVSDEQLQSIEELPIGLRTAEKTIVVKTINNAAVNLSEIKFSLLPDGTFKKVSSSGSLNYELKPIDKFKLAVIYKKSL